MRVLKMCWDTLNQIKVNLNKFAQLLLTGNVETVKFLRRWKRFYKMNAGLNGSTKLAFHLLRLELN